MKTREQRAKFNIITSLGLQLITLICGFVLPRIIISSYGSESYGAVTSITQFLSYITLLEGGVCGVARAALYKPLADNDLEKISSIKNEIGSFFRKLSFIFVVYTIVLAFSFKYIAHFDSLDYVSTVMLVFAISISTVSQYLFGITYSVFLQAAQKVYIINGISIITVIANTIATIFLIYFGWDLVVVKLVSSLIFIIKPLFYMVYVRKHYSFCKVRNNKNVLSQKWDALGQHIAYFLHSNTDVVVLTIFASLKSVAVYSIYNLIVASLQNLIYGFSSGMEALFGDMLVKYEFKELNKKFDFFETIISIIAGIIFSTTIAMIVPFVNLYTSGLNDADYSQPVFSVVLTLVGLIFCIRLPYHAVIVAAGKFKETRIGSYGEAAINIVLSIVFVNSYGIIGVACATVFASAFRFLYYAAYLRRDIIKRPLKCFLKRQIMTIGTILILFFVDRLLSTSIDVSTYYGWIGCAVCVFVVNSLIILCLNYFVYPTETKIIINNIVLRKKK